MRSDHGQVMSHTIAEIALVTLTGSDLSESFRKLTLSSKWHAAGKTTSLSWPKIHGLREQWDGQGFAIQRH